MKKYISLLFAAALTLGFTACEDVPAPYQIASTDSSDGGGGSTAEATGEGSLQSPYNCVKANEVGAALASGATTDTMVYIKGIVSSVKEEYGQYGNATFYISDDGTSTNQFYVYRALYLGNENFTEGKTNIKAGDEVVVCGKVVNYLGNTPETVKGEAYLYSLKSNDVTPDTPDTPSATLDGTVFTATDWNIANGTALETITLSDGTTLTFDGGGKTNVPKYYDNGTNVRMYPQNSITVTSASKKIAKISFLCDTYSGDIYYANKELVAEPGLVSASDNILVVSNINALSSKITLNPTATSGVNSQLRFTKIAIKYAE